MHLLAAHLASFHHCCRSRRPARSTASRPFLNLHCSAREWFLGCVNLATLLPLAVGCEYTQPRINSYWFPCTIGTCRRQITQPIRGESRAWPGHRFWAPHRARISRGRGERDRAGGRAHLEDDSGAANAAVVVDGTVAAAAAAAVAVPAAAATSCRRETAPRGSSISVVGVAFRAPTSAAFLLFEQLRGACTGFLAS